MRQATCKIWHVACLFYSMCKQILANKDIMAYFFAQKVCQFKKITYICSVIRTY